MNKTTKLVFGAILAIIWGAVSGAQMTHSQAPWSSDRDRYFQEFMTSFEQNPLETMLKTPPKFNIQGERQEMKFAVNFEQRQNFRAKIHKAPVGFAAWDMSNNPQAFFPANFSMNRNVISLAQSISATEATVRPWSGDYWATYKGGIGARYNDPSFPHSWDFIENYKAYKEYQKVDFADSAQVNNLSPSEKFDILVGDTGYGLTAWSFESAYRTYTQNNNEIEPWFGICHGWAPASYMLPRPDQTISFQIENFKGHSFQLNFYPDDLKALGSLLWANARLKTYFLGGRCNVKNPQMDENGRVTDPACFDLNPASWHLASIHQLAKNQSGLVFDANFDYEVWNQPIIRMKWNYFNPQTKEETNKIDSAIIKKSDFEKDIFKKYRSSAGEKIVGVKMIVTFATENTPHHEFDLFEQNVRDVVYIYDLELNARDEIIGGEWYQADHPDFMWTPPKGAHAASHYDATLEGSWDGEKPLPADWKNAAKNSSRQGLPLGRIVEKLFEKAHLSQ